MDIMPPCPHCQVPNPAGATFCGSCGKALPASAPQSPRVLSVDDFAATKAGREPQTEELARQSKKAAGALLAVAILQTVFAVLILVGAKLLPSQDANVEIDPVAIVFTFGLSAIFFGLYLWARRNPLPAAIVGLVLFVTVHLVDALFDPMAIVRGIIVKIIVIVVLARAISAGAKHRRLVQQMRA